MTIRPDEFGAHDDISLCGGEWLGVGPQHRLWVGGHNTTLRAKLEHALQGCPRPPMGEIDAAILTPESINEALYFSAKIRTRMSQHGTLIVLFPTSVLVENAMAETLIMEELAKQGWTPNLEGQPTTLAKHVVLRLATGRLD